MFKFGLKLWSTNENYVKEAIRLYENKVFDYIELYAVPGSYEKHAQMWTEIDIPYLIHAPHCSHGVNIAKSQNRENNFRLIAEAQKYADKLKAGYIILHPGFDGQIEESILQINTINDSRILIENMPYLALQEDLVCLGNSPDQINYLIQKTGVRFCLDIGHAVYSANSRATDWTKDLREYIALIPNVYHLSDGKMEGKKDEHLHFREGNFQLDKILGLLPEDIFLTIETKKGSQNDLKDFKNDALTLRKLLIKMEKIKSI